MYLELGGAESQFCVFTAKRTGWEAAEEVPGRAGREAALEGKSRARCWIELQVAFYHILETG